MEQILRKETKREIVGDEEIVTNSYYKKELLQQGDINILDEYAEWNDDYEALYHDGFLLGFDGITGLSIEEFLVFAKHYVEVNDDEDDQFLTFFKAIIDVLVPWDGYRMSW
jgi:hypothetical protein